VLFVVPQADDEERRQLLEAIFGAWREDLVKQVQSGAVQPSALAAHDYVYDVFPAAEELAAVR